MAPYLYTRFFTNFWRTGDETKLRNWEGEELGHESRRNYIPGTPAEVINLIELQQLQLYSNEYLHECNNCTMSKDFLIIIMTCSCTAEL